MDKFRDKTRDNLYDNLINLGVDCKLAKRKIVEEKLFNIWPGLLKSLEKESITLFPKVKERLKNSGLEPRTVRYMGKIIDVKKRAA